MPCCVTQSTGKVKEPLDLPVAEQVCSTKGKQYSLYSLLEGFLLEGSG